MNRITVFVILIKQNSCYNVILIEWIAYFCMYAMGFTFFFNSQVIKNPNLK